MVEDSLAPGEDPLQSTGNSTIPPVYTYWGQFIDHDLTANTDRDAEVSNITKADLAPLDPAFVVKNLKNLRQPTLNLDSVYGDGPTFNPSKPTKAGRMYDGIKLRVGKVAKNPDPLPDPSNPPIRGVPIPPEGDDLRDLPRIGTLIGEGVVKEEDFSENLRNKPNFRQLAFIADARNDENLIVAQLHIAFLRFHNAVVDQPTNLSQLPHHYRLPTSLVLSESISNRGANFHLDDADHGINFEDTGATTTP
jgi:hypothetical protein